MNKTRWAWYLLLSGIAVVSAEMLSWSTPLIFPVDPFVHVIYALHYILIVDFLVRRRAITWRTLAVAGVVLGFATESLLTKVIWNPPWDEGETLRVLGLGVFEVGFIVLVWHAWMSVTLPFALALSAFGKVELLSPRRMRRVLLALPLTMWVAAGLNGAAPPMILLATALNGAGIVLAAWLYTRYARRHPLPSVAALALGTRERRIVWGGLLACYALLLPVRAEAFPSAGPFVLGMLLLVGSIALLVAVARRDAGQMPRPGAWRYRPRAFVRYLAYFAAVSLALGVLALLTAPVAAPLTVALMLLAMLPGDAYMLRLVWRHRPRRRSNKAERSEPFLA